MNNKLLLKIGLTTALILITWLFGGFLLLQVLFRSTPSMVLRAITGGLGLVILFTGVFYATKTAQRSTGKSSFGFGRAFYSGMFVTIVVAICVSLASFVYVGFINKHFADDMVRETEVSLRASGTPPEQMTKKLQAVRREFSLPSQVIAPLIVQTIAGSFFSLVLSVYFNARKK